MVEKNQIVAFTLDDQQFGLNLSSVERIVRAVEITPVPDSPTQILGIINVEGHVMPVLNTRKWLGLPEREIELQDVFVIVSVNGHSIALVADEVKPVTEVPLNEVINSHEVIRSTGSVERIAKLEDGLMMVLTAERAISLEELGKLDSVLSETESN
jgi:purine-binding chemotaxis protein CheW